MYVGMYATGLLRPDFQEELQRLVQRLQDELTHTKQSLALGKSCHDSFWYLSICLSVSFSAHSLSYTYHLSISFLSGTFSFRPIEIEKKSRELEQQRKQDEADRAISEMQKLRELEAAHRWEIETNEKKILKYYTEAS